MLGSMLAGNAAALNVQGAALATVIAEYATLLIGLLMVRKILNYRGISGEMLKTAWRGNFRRLLALTRYHAAFAVVATLFQRDHRTWCATGE